MWCWLDLSDGVFWTQQWTFRFHVLTYSMEQSPSWEANQSLQLVKKFPAFYGIRKFFTVFTSDRHLSLSWANSIQSPQPPPTSWRSILILSPIYVWVSPIRTTCPAHLILFDFTTRTILGKESGGSTKDGKILDWLNISLSRGNLLYGVNWRY
jgi:hypothetical protein